MIEIYLTFKDKKIIVDKFIDYKKEKIYIKNNKNNKLNLYMLKPYSNKACNVIKKYELNSVLTEESKTMILKYCDTGKLVSIWLESLDKSNKILLKEGEK